MSAKNYVKGTCTQMCPPGEVAMREKESLLHRFEMVKGTERTRKPKADRKRMVKCFCRSGAGQEIQAAGNLRPPEVLLETINYLMLNILPSKDYSFCVVYDFIMDRLRSIRQDMVVQSLDKAPTIAIFQPIVRFYAYSAYRLCEEVVGNFDPVINNKHLQECMKKILVMYDECDRFKRKCDELELGLIDYDLIYSDCRSNIEALYILHNLGESAPIIRCLNLPKKWRSDDLNIALKISLNYLRGNWITVCRLMKKLPSLLAAVAALNLPEIRRKAYIVMSLAYNSKTLGYPLTDLKEIFLYTNASDLLVDLQHYNISYNRASKMAQFIKSSFDMNKKAVQTRQEYFVHAKWRNKPIQDIVLYGNI